MLQPKKSAGPTGPDAGNVIMFDAHHHRRTRAYDDTGSSSRAAQSVRTPIGSASGDDPSANECPPAKAAPEPARDELLDIGTRTDLVGCAEAVDGEHQEPTSCDSDAFPCDDSAENSSKARSIRRSVSTVTRELPCATLTTVFSASPELSATRRHGSPLANSRFLNRRNVRSIIMADGLPHLNEVCNAAHNDEVAPGMRPSQKCGMTSDEVRTKLSEFMQKHELVPYRWSPASGLGQGTLAAFMKGGPDKTIEMRTLQKLVAGARKLLNDESIQLRDIIGVDSIEPSSQDAREDFPLGREILQTLQAILLELRANTEETRKNGIVSRENNELLRSWGPPPPLSRKVS